MENLQHWYAVYTKPRSEKKLAERLSDQGIEAYLPMRKTLKQWSDRKKMVSEPLISSYVFVNIFQKDYLEVLKKCPKRVRYMWFCGKPAVIPSNRDPVIEAYHKTRTLISNVFRHLFPQGTRVQVVSVI